MRVGGDVASDGFRWVTVGSPGQDVDIVLSQPHGGRSQAEGDALLSLVTKGSLQAAIFRSDDLDATFEKVRASGAEVLREPATQPWGVRDCAFRDPSGNLVRIAQPWPLPSADRNPHLHRRSETHEKHDLCAIGWAV